MKKKYLAVAGALVLAALPLRGVRADATDAQSAQIIDEGLSHSQAMVNASELMDGIGPRLTNSEKLRQGGRLGTGQVQDLWPRQHPRRILSLRRELESRFVERDDD